MPGRELPGAQSRTHVGGKTRTSGSTSGGVVTDRMEAGLRTKRKRGQEALDPTRHRATPRLYFLLYPRSTSMSLAARRH